MGIWLIWFNLRVRCDVGRVVDDCWVIRVVILAVRVVWLIGAVVRRGGGSGVITDIWSYAVTIQSTVSEKKKYRECMLCWKPYSRSDCTSHLQDPSLVFIPALLKANTLALKQVHTLLFEIICGHKMGKDCKMGVVTYVPCNVKMCFWPLWGFKECQEVFDCCLT